MAYHANENTEIIPDNLGTAANLAKSGKQLREYKHATGNYYIKPEGYSGSAIECNVDMDMDGGGWVLCGCFAKSHSGFSMSGNTGGLNTSALKGFLNSSPANNASALLPKAFINQLWHQNNNSKYTDWTVCFMHGRSAGGYLLGQVKPKGEYKLSTFDMYEGIYFTYNLNDKFFIKTYLDGDNSDSEWHNRGLLHWREGTNDNTPWTNYASGRANYASGGYHYLSDDHHGGGEWMFRENADDTPANAYGGSSNVGSRFWIR